MFRVASRSLFLFAALAASARADSGALAQAERLERQSQFQEAAWVLSEAGLEHQAAALMEKWEKLVRSAEVIGVEELPNSITKAKKLILRTRDGLVFPVVFKRDAEGVLDAASADAEVGMYELDRALGANMVPAARKFHFGGVDGSVHAWVEDTIPVLSASERREALYDGAKRPYPEAQQMKNVHALAHSRKPDDLLFLDKLASNNDRHSANFAFRHDPNGTAEKANSTLSGKKDSRRKVVAWDNGLAFSVRGSTRVAAEWPQASAKIIARLRETSPEEFTRRLGPYLSRKRLRAFLLRRESALEAQRGVVRNQFGEACQTLLFRMFGFVGR